MWRIYSLSRPLCFFPTRLGSSQTASVPHIASSSSLTLRTYFYLCLRLYHPLIKHEVEVTKQPSNRHEDRSAFDASPSSSDFDLHIDTDPVDYTKASKQQLKDSGLEGIAYAAELLLKLRSPNMPSRQDQTSDFPASAGMARKRGLPYARNEMEQPSPHAAQSHGGGNGSGFYISGPRPAKLFPSAMHEFRKGKYATTGGERGFMTGKSCVLIARILTIDYTADALLPTLDDSVRVRRTGQHYDD